MKLTPSSTARRKTFFAFSRSGGQPQIPSPVSRIAPKPSRLTSRSPPNSNVESLACAVAATIFSNPPVRTPAAPAEITPKNVLRLIAGKICCCYERSSTSPTESVEQRNPQSSALPPHRNFSLKSHRPECLPMSEISYPFTKNAAMILFQSDSSKCSIWAHRWRQGCFQLVNQFALRKLSKSP